MSESAMPEPRSTSITELTGDQSGRWVVTTHGSTHLIDLDNRTVERIPGLHSKPTINDTVRPRRTLDACRVGESGRWTMQPDDYTIDFYWHQTSTIISIDRITPDATTDTAGPADSGATR